MMAGKGVTLRSFSGVPAAGIIAVNQYDIILSRDDANENHPPIDARMDEKESRMKKMKLAALIGSLLLIMPLRAEINFLYVFSGTAIDGSSPNGLVLSGTTLYGMTHGISNTGSENGTIFKIETDGTGFTLLHTFVGGADDGKWPSGSLIISGTTLYGMTMFGGDHDRGTVFKLNTDGTGFTLLHEFTGGVADGQSPQGDLILSDSTLFGMTMRGGNHEPFDCGTIFTIDVLGGHFALLHRFSFGDGAYPRGNLILSGTTLFGMTEGISIQGDDSNCGTIFAIQTHGGGFTILHEFAGGANGGKGPFGSLLLADSTLYGMTCYGGDSDLGTIFKMHIDGSGFALLHEFADGPGDGSAPHGSLIISGSTLYGMTWRGGEGMTGTIFEMRTNGTGFALLYGFGRYDSAASPEGTPLLQNSTLYGVVNFGSVWGRGDGVIFSLPLANCVLDLQAERREVRAFSIVGQYAYVHFRVESSDIPVAKYWITRRAGDGEFFLRKTVLPTELRDERFQMLDKYLDRDKPYTYRVEAYDASGTLIGISPEKTI
jgi:uncharacterized repeat protein (TIGR03803 family)